LLEKSECLLNEDGVVLEDATVPGVECSIVHSAGRRASSND